MPVAGGRPASYDAGKKIKGRKRHIAVDVKGTPIMVEVHTAEVQDRDGAPAVILGMLAKAPEVTKLRADGGYQGPKLASKLEELGLGGLLEIVEQPEDFKGFTVLYRRRVVVRTFGWLTRCRQLAKDFERRLASRFMMRRIARASRS